MEKKSVKKNYIFNTAYQILAICVPLITAPYLSRRLTADGIGVFSYTHSIVSYFLLVAVLGSSTFGQKQIASVRDRKNELSNSFWEIVLFRCFMVVITLIAYFVFLRINNKYNSTYLIWTLNIVNVLVDITWFFQGVEEFPKIVVRNFIVRIAQIVCIFLFIKTPDDLNLYVAFIAGFTVIANIWTWFFVPKYVGKPTQLNIFRNFREMIMLFLPTIATQVYLVLDKSMIGIITDSTYQNGCYEQSEKIARMALTVVTSVAAVILPRVANLYNNNDKDKAKEYIYKGFSFTWMLSFPIMFGLIGISNIFVPVFFGPGYDLAKVLMPIFSVLVLAVSVAYITGFSFLIPIGKQNVYTIIVCISATLNFFANMILIPQIGAIGAAFASVGAEVVGALLQIIYCDHKKLLDKKMIFYNVWHYVVSGIIMLIFIKVLGWLLPENIISLVSLIISGAIVYAVALMLMRDSFFVDNTKQVICTVLTKCRIKQHDK